MNTSIIRAVNGVALIVVPLFVLYDSAVVVGPGPSLAEVTAFAVGFAAALALILVASWLKPPTTLVDSGGSI